MSTMQWNCWKLPDVLNWAVPGQAIKHVWNDAKINAVHARQFQCTLHHAVLALRRKEYFIDKQRPSPLKQRVVRADDIHCPIRICRTGTGHLNKAFECITEMPDTLQVMTERMRFRP